MLFVPIGIVGGTLCLKNSSILVQLAVELICYIKILQLSNNFGSTYNIYSS